MRIGPNRLSFASIQAYQDIYGHLKHGQKRFLKNSWYDPKFDASHQDPRLVRVRDPTIHADQRKALSHAFSARALRSQEEVIHHYVDLFLEQLDKLGKGGKEPVNTSRAWSWLTFDVIGLYHTRLLPSLRGKRRRKKKGYDLLLTQAIRRPSFR